MRNRNPLFDAIYQAAKTQNRASLKALVDDGIGLNVCWGYLTPVMLLAIEGDDDAVNLLLDEFQGNNSQAAAGYAYAGRRDALEVFLKKGVLLDDVAFGFALGNYSEFLEPLLVSPLIFESVIQAYAIMKQVKKVDALSLSHPDSAWAAYTGYASAGHDDMIESVFNDEAKHTFFPMILFGYAQQCNLTVLMAMLKKLEGQPQYQEYLDEAMRGLCYQGVTGASIDALKHLGASFESMALGYASGGYTKELVSVLSYVRQHNLKDYKNLLVALCTPCAQSADLNLTRLWLSHLQAVDNEVFWLEDNLHALIYQAAYFGNKYLVDYLCAEFKPIDSLTEAARGYFFGRHFEAFGDIVRRGAICSRMLIRSKYLEKFLSEDLTYFFGCIPQNKRIDIADMLEYKLCYRRKRSKAIDKLINNMDAHLAKANVIEQVMQVSSFTYREAILWHDGLNENDKAALITLFCIAPTIVHSDASYEVMDLLIASFASILVPDAMKKATPYAAAHFGTAVVDSMKRHGLFKQLEIIKKTESALVFDSDDSMDCSPSFSFI